MDWLWFPQHINKKAINAFKINKITNKRNKPKWNPRDLTYEAVSCLPQISRDMNVNFPPHGNGGLCCPEGWLARSAFSRRFLRWLLSRGNPYIGVIRGPSALKASPEKKVYIILLTFFFFCVCKLNVSFRCCWIDFLTWSILRFASLLERIEFIH